jgi:predicted nuclease of restriction endonuclease-like (RecB) superfamily
MIVKKEFSAIINIIEQARQNAYNAVNVELINCYWQVGEFISSRVYKGKWGDKTVQELADYIQNEHPNLKGYNRRGLYRMKQFYETYANSQFVSPAVTQIEMTKNRKPKIVTPAVTQLSSGIRQSMLCQISWTHHLVILSGAKTEAEREFYINLCIKERYGKRELERQISSGLFERVVIGKQNLPLSKNELQKNIANTFKDNYVFEFLNLPEEHSEDDLQKALIKQLKAFILELGKDFLFIGEEYRLQVGNSDFYIDLLFYHRTLRCLAAFELKADKFKPEHIGQLSFYLEALDRDVKKPDENPSIGILLCRSKDDAVVEYAMNRYLSPALVAEYQTKLPDKKLLQERVRGLFKGNS